MEDPEVPLEHLQDELEYRAKHGENWTLGVALTAAILAGLAAISALLSGHHANEGMLDQIRASDQWSYYQAKGIKASVLTAKKDIFTAIGKPVDERDQEKLLQYKKEQDEVFRDAKEREKESQAHMRAHVIYARGVTLFQVAIAVSAVSVLTRRRPFWYLGIAFGVLGVGFLIQGLLFDGLFS
jgi:hypothetical protein